MDQLKKLFSRLTVRQKISLAAAALLVGAALFGLAHWNRERDFKPLYTSLALEDAGAVLSRLREEGVEYRVADGGATILVASSQVAEARLRMAASGLPRSGRIGFELFDKNSFGATDFAQQVNYHRALEGELERSVMALTEVERARVHITLPKDSLFAESRRPAKASVLVKLRPGASLAAPQVAAVTHLVASAVDGLAPEGVSVLDMRGNLLNRSRTQPPGAEEANSEAALAYRQSVEKDLLAKIRLTLEPLLGAERFRAGVSVDCDFTSGEQSEETFDPGRSVMVNSQRTEDLTGAHAAAGVPGTASNLPRPTSRPGTAAGGVARRTESVAYQSSRTVRRVRLPQGTVRRISVSLLVDHRVRWEGSGNDAKRIVEAPPPDRMKAIRDLVAAATGLQPERGDQLYVETLPFESTLSWEPPGPPAAPSSPALPWWLARLLGLPRLWLLGIAGGAVIVLLAVLVLLWRLRSARPAPAELNSQTALPPGAAGEPPEDSLRRQLEAKIAEQTALREKELEALNALNLPSLSNKKAEVLSKHIADEAKKNAAVMANIIRTWLNEGGN